MTVKGKNTGPPYICWLKKPFAVDFPVNQASDSGDRLMTITHGLLIMIDKPS